MDYSEDNILTKVAILIIYEDGQYTIIPKMEGYNNHIHYVVYEIKNNNNSKLANLLKDVDLDEIIKEPSKFLAVANALTKTGNIIFLNWACNYMGPTNYYSVNIPKSISEKAKDTIKIFEEYIKELEFDHIGVYNDEFQRNKVIASKDFFEVIKLGIEK